MPRRRRRRRAELFSRQWFRHRIRQYPRTFTAVSVLLTIIIASVLALRFINDDPPPPVEAVYYE